MFLLLLIAMSSTVNYVRHNMCVPFYVARYVHFSAWDTC